jgi:mycofactocin system glycosyltransferase
VLGGSPRRLLRLSEAGASLLDRLGAGDRLRASTGRSALVRRLVAAGVLHPAPSPDEGPAAEHVSLVVPVRDDPHGVERLLETVRAGAEAPREVVVVDDASVDPDRLRQVVGRFGPDVRLERLERNVGPAAARNRGAAVATGAVLAFVDADVEPGGDWLAPLRAQLADPEVALVAPRVAATEEPAGVRARYDRSCSPLDLGRHPAEVVRGGRVAFVPSAAVLVRRRVFDQLGGFDVDLRLGEDVDLVWRAHASGWRTRYQPDAVVRHRVRPSWRAWVGQRAGYGRSAAALDRRHPGAVAPWVVSPWSAAVVVLLVSGHPLAASTVVAGTTERLRRELDGVPLPEVLRLSVGGHAAALRQLSRALVREWWPLSAFVAVGVRGLRRPLLVAVCVHMAASLREAADRAPVMVGPATFAGLRLLDDLAYGSGVWWGCAQQRSLRALLPSSPSR